MRGEDVAMTLEAGAGGRLADLYATHAPGAIRLAFLMTGDKALAEDLVHDAFAKVAGRLAHLRRPEGFEPYLRRTIVNLANNYFRRRAVERAYLSRTAGEPGVVDSDAASRSEMWSLLLQLPARQRAAVVLRYYEDLSDEQIGEILECRPGTVRSLLSRGMQGLRSTMRGEIDA